MLKKFNNRKKKKGFTLIELVIVLAVLAIIALIAIPNFTKVREDSQEKADNQSLEAIEKIFEMEIIEENIPDTLTSVFKVTVGEDDKGKKKITVAPTVAIPDDKIVYSDIVNGLADINTPQQKNRTDYYIKVANGSVVNKATTLVQ